MDYSFEKVKRLYDKYVPTMVKGKIGGSLYLNSLTSAEGLILPEYIGRKIYANDCVREYILSEMNKKTR